MFGLGALARGGAKSGAKHGMASTVTGAATTIGMTYAIEKASGKSSGDALSSGILWYAGERMFGGGLMMVPMIADVAKAGYDMYRNQKLYGKGEIAKYYKSNFGGNYQDTQQAYTMRQRAVQAMQQSRMNARSVLGSEARTFHR